MALTNVNEATERIASRNPSVAGFSLMEGGRATMKLIIDEPRMEEACKEILGYAEAGLERIVRTLPVAHPQFPWLYAERISSIEGLEFFAKYDSNENLGDTFVQVPMLENYARYNKYELTIEFTPRPYALQLDINLGRNKIDWFDENNVAQSNFYYPEWARFFEILYKPSAEYITAVGGQLVWKMDANNALGMQNKTVSGGQIRSLMQSTALEMKWYCVPYSYVTSTNSNINKCLGHVNYDTFYGHKGGKLLLVGAEITRVYCPPFPKFTAWNGGAGGLPSQNKLCDITFHVLLKDIEPKNAYTVTMDNNMTNGHNLVLAGFDNNHYYVENSNSGKPLYPSYPFQLLFTNPD